MSPVSPASRNLLASPQLPGLERKSGWKCLQTILSMLLLGLAAQTGYAKPPEGALAITQIPLNAQHLETGDILDQRYPTGSRVVLVVPGEKGGNVRILSKGLSSAGAPVVTPDGNRVFFNGKAASNSGWQIYRAEVAGGQPQIVTSISGGAMDPAIISTGDLVFSSPVPKRGETWSTRTPSALYAQSLGGTPRRLTFGPVPALEPTVLRDGRILFISFRQYPTTSGIPSAGLFTVNNDGTEVTAYALDNDGAPVVHRPRELLDGRVGFLAGPLDNLAGLTLECVRTARPFLTRSPLQTAGSVHARAIEPDGSGGWLICAETQGTMGRYWAVTRVNPGVPAPGQTIFHEPDWNEVEAVPVKAHPAPMGHITAIMPAKPYGTILCLNADFTRKSSSNSVPVGKTAKVRILIPNEGRVEALGEVPVQADGSFMAEVPAETPLGFETLDSQGKVLQRSQPFFWVHPGENRSCIGCHEPYNRTLRNIRPMAASLPPVVLAPVGRDGHVARNF